MDYIRIICGPSRSATILHIGVSTMAHIWVASPLLRPLQYTQEASTTHPRAWLELCAGVLFGFGQGNLCPLGGMM